MLKKDSKFRFLIITLLFVLGVADVFLGWRITGKLTGLLIMLFGVVLLLLALFVYNAPYFVKKE